MGYRLLSRLFIALVLLICWSIAKPSELQDHIKLKKLYLEAEKPVISNRSAYMLVDENTTNYLNLGFDLGLFKLGYLNSKVVSQTNESQFRHVGLHSELGVTVYGGVELYLRHFSGHIIDGAYPTRFPQENALGLRLILYKEK